MNPNRVVTLLLERSAQAITGDFCTVTSGRRDSRSKQQADNNLLKSLVVSSISVLLLLSVGFVIPGQALSKPDTWVAEEDEQIRNGLSSETVALSSGEASVNFTNKLGGGTQYVNPASDTGPEVDHLSKVLFDTQSSPVLFVSPGDSIPFANAVVNTGNGTDTYSIRQSASLSNNWDTGIFLDQDADGVLDPGDPEITSSAEITDLASRDTSHIILTVEVPAGNSVAQRDTFTVTARSKRTEDPVPGQDTTHMIVQTDTSSVDVFNPTQPFDFVDTQAITNDTSVLLDFTSLSEVDEQNLTYEDPTGATSSTGFDPFVTGDSMWTLTDEEGVHTFRVQYRFDNGELSDTYVDTIELDHSKPRDLQLFINRDADTAASLNVTLDTFAASDTNWQSGSGRGRVVIDNDTSFTTADVDTRIVPTDGDLSGTSWEMTTQAQVFAKFIDAAGNVSDTVSDTIALNVNTINLDKSQYVGLRDEARVTINDFGANDDPGAIDDTFVIITSELDDDGIRVKVTETSVNSGLFEGTFRFTEGFSDDAEDKIFVEPNARVTASYVNAAGSLSEDTATWVRQAGVDRSVDDVRTWPNPFRPLQGQPFVFQNLPADQGMEIMIFNVSGQLVRQLTVGRGIEFNPNGNTARWFGRNDVGDMLSSGTYIYVVKSKYGTKRGKLTLVK